MKFKGRGGRRLRVLNTIRSRDLGKPYFHMCPLLGDLASGSDRS